MNRLQTVLSFAFESGACIDVAHGYNEPGYGDPDSGVVVFGDWNPSCGFDKPQAEQDRDLMVRLARVLEALGADTQWSDEWTTCGQCHRAIRTSPDSYSWVPSFRLTDGEVECAECLLSDPADYVESYLLNDVDSADTFGVDLSALGFTQAEAGENGWHPGQNDTPEQMVEALADGLDYVFQIDGTGQFDVQFSIWTRPDTYTSETE